MGHGRAGTTTATPVGDEPDAPRAPTRTRDRSTLGLLWYRLVQHVATTLFAALGGVRATGRRNLPASGAALLVSNHLSHLDVFVLGLTQPRPLNYVARSTL